MRTWRYILFLWPFICSHPGIEAFGQVPGQSPYQKVNYREDLIITTDRQLYITGEKVHIKAYLINGLKGFPEGLSRIAYLELLNTSNNPVTQIKIEIERSSGYSSLALSDTLSSGNYLIRGYTAWMRNFPEEFFGYRMISVINPFKEPGSILASITDPVTENNLFTRGNETNFPNIPYGKAIEIKAHLNKDIFGTREKVRVDLSVSGPEGKTVEAVLSVSVIKSFLSENDLNCFPENPGKEKEIPELNGYPTHLPEPEGVLLQGVIFSKTTNEPLKETDISLSLVGTRARCQFVKTNSEGEFVFVMKDLTGIEEIVIQPLIPDHSGIYVELQHPFCETYSSYVIPSLRMDSASAGRINNAIIAMQVNRMFESEIPKKNTGKLTRMNNFFGNPVRTVRTSDYVELSDIREVVKEIIPEVAIFRKDRQPALKVVSSNPYQIFSDQALVLFDGVPVLNIDKLLNTNARELERIEIINSRYFYAGYVFEGIISFISKKGDFNSLEDENSSFRQAFEGCPEKEGFYSPVYDSDSARLTRIPDFRNTLFWKPDVIVTEGETAEIEFYTSDEAAEYIIVAEGFTSEGKRIRSTLPLIVR